MATRVEAPITLRQALAQLYMERGIVVTSRVESEGGRVVGLRTVLFMDGDVLTEVAPSLKALSARRDLLTEHEAALQKQLLRLATGLLHARLFLSAAATAAAIVATARKWAADPSWIHRLIVTAAGAAFSVASFWLARKLLAAIVRHEIRRRTMS